ncbi:hypothetical protein ACFLWC_04855 [Chloroflexota bacterium]
MENQKSYMPRQLNGTVTKSSSKISTGQPKYLGICIKKGNGEDEIYPRIGDIINLIDSDGRQYGPIKIGKMGNKYRVRLMKEGGEVNRLLLKYFPGNIVNKRRVKLAYSGRNNQYEISFHQN